MAVNAIEELRNAWADQIEVVAGANAILRARTGVKPAGGPSASRTGTILWSVDLGTGYMDDADDGAATFSGTPSGAASDDGTIGHWELMKSNGTTCVLHGNAGEGITFDTNVISDAAQIVTVASCSFTMGNGGTT
jgi:hypothetical protein